MSTTTSTALTKASDLPKILTTPRLTLRLADPDDLSDCQKIISVYNDPHASLGGNARVGINTPSDVHAKHTKQGPRQPLCTKSEAPKGLFHLVTVTATGDFVGFIGLSFRQEMPYPDLGYALFKPFWGKGYAAEAGREALRFWREEVGVVEMFAGALEGNERSLKTAERIGFVRGGGFEVEFGVEGEKRMRAVAMVLPGMKFEEGQVVRPTVGVETQEQRTAPVRVN